MDFNKKVKQKIGLNRKLKELPNFKVSGAGSASEERYFRTKNTLFCNIAVGSLCDCQGSSNTKNECDLFYLKLDAEYFCTQQFFRKKAVFSEKTVKNYFGDAFDKFSRKGGVLRQKLT